MDDEVVVLREVWLDEGAPTERQIQQSIFASLDEFGTKLMADPAFSPPHFSKFGPDLVKEVRALFEDEANSTLPVIPGVDLRRKVYEKYFLTIREGFVGRATRFHSY